ncbi:hypothetical protein DB42_BQ00150 [Neochlamydia sp. EPS4]|nr:hypothetical protein DB42_BQ00150 [Neochlamydia sp. EPS4]
MLSTLIISGIKYNIINILIDKKYWLIGFLYYRLGYLYKNLQNFLYPF